VNPPFQTNRPTIIAFGGGNCSTGSGMNFGGTWEEQANWLTVDSYGPVYTRYGDMLMVYLSAVAPDYKEPIQAMGFSTGNLPAMDVAWYVNLTYKDARYAVNRVSLLDAVCSLLSTRVAQFHTNVIAGEQCWVDNYISNDPNYSRRAILPGALNVVCNPARAHAYPVQRYATSSLEYTNGGLTAFAYLSLIGSGKNYQLNTASQKYYFVINSTESIVFFNQTSNPGKILAPVKLTGPTNGTTFDSSGATLGCQSVENAVRYQLLLGSDPHRVMDFSAITDTTNPPSQHLSTLPQQRTWWTVRAFDQFGSTIYADPRLIQRPENHPPIANGGPDLVLYAGLDGKATATLTGLGSSDPDGDALSFTWAWAMGTDLHQSTQESLTIDLPVGEHTIQLMVSDGQSSSEPDQVKVTVVAPLEVKAKLAPSTINVRSSGPYILARIWFPEGLTRAEMDNTQPLSILPAGVQTITQRIIEDDTGQVSILARFDKDAVLAQTHNGAAEFTIVGTLRSGRMFYARDTIRIIATKKEK
jgi:hypothetical protein